MITTRDEVKDGKDRDVGDSYLDEATGRPEWLGRTGNRRFSRL